MISDKWLVKRGGRYTRSEQLQAREVLRINDPNRHIVVIDHDQVVDAMALKEIQDFDREFVFVHCDWI